MNPSQFGDARRATRLPCPVLNTSFYSCNWQVSIGDRLVRSAYGDFYFGLDSRSTKTRRGPAKCRPPTRSQTTSMMTLLSKTTTYLPRARPNAHEYEGRLTNLTIRAEILRPTHSPTLKRKGFTTRWDNPRRPKHDPSPRALSLGQTTSRRIYSSPNLLSLSQALSGYVGQSGRSQIRRLVHHRKKIGEGSK